MTANLLRMAKYYHGLDWNGPISAVPVTVRDAKTGLIGTIDYGDAMVLSADGDSGTFVVPIRLTDGRWAVLLWKLEGEFDTYLGLEVL